MINEELLSYIRGQLKAGASRDDIKKALATGGWSEQDAKEAFDAIDGVVKPPAPPVPMAPKPFIAPKAPVPATIRPTAHIGIGEAARMAQSGSPGPVAPMQQTPMQPTPQQVTPRLEIDTRPVATLNTAHTSAMPTQITKSRVPWLFISVLVILIVLGGAAYWFYPELMGGVNAVMNTFFQTSTETTPATDFPIEEVVPNGASTTPTTTAGSVDNPTTSD